MTLLLNKNQNQSISNPDILLPRGYLSYSAMTMWESSQDRFIKDYFEGGPRMDTKYLRFGKGFAQSIEDGGYKTTHPDLPVYGEIEFELRLTINGVPILGFIDSYSIEDNLILEYKTGKNPWTRSKVQKHAQLVFYATACYELTGKMPEYADLVWLETKEGSHQVQFGLGNEGHYNDNIEFTGKMMSFRRNFQFSEIENMKARILKNAIEISNRYKEYIKDLEL